MYTIFVIINMHGVMNLFYTRTPLHVSLMLSFGGGFASVAAVPGVQIALDLINANPHLLPGYTIHYSLSDSQVFEFCSLSFYCY